jgi:hypothetical protein
MSDQLPFPDLWSKNEKGEVTACPCLALNIFLDETDHGHLLAFYERALEPLRPHLTHYLAESMRQPAKLTPRAFGMVPTWLGRPKECHDYRMRMWGGGSMDVSPWSIEFLYTDIPYDPDRRARYPKFLADIEKKADGGQPRIPGTVVRVTVPVDSELARPEAWVPWVLGFDILRDGWFMVAESGYSMTTRGDIHDQGFMRVACSRYPGLDWFDADHVKFLRRYEPSLDAAVFQVKRAAWLTFVHESAIQVLGDAEKIRAELADEPRIVLHPVTHGLGIQTGPTPELGDLSRHELIPLQRRVARVLRPVRLKAVPLAWQEEFVRHWFNMFDNDDAATPEP